MLSICITVKNRSRVKVEEQELYLFPNCVRSIVESLNSGIESELVVTDWESYDWPLGEWLEEAASPIPVNIITVTGPFSRGKGLNLAAGNAKGNILFFIDADVILCPTIFEFGIKYITQGRTYFPIFFGFDEPNHNSGTWWHAAYGTCMVLKEIFKKSGGWPVYYTWGKEDREFFSKISSLGEAIRETVPGFYHQWHPPDPDRVRIVQEMNKEIGNTILSDIERVIPKGRTLIVVNQESWSRNILSGYSTFPFLERDGQYWGPPPDDETAIRELERLRQSRANFIVFTEPAFWWLDHYTDFQKYLRSKFRCVLENERLLVFGLSSP